MAWSLVLEGHQDASDPTPALKGLIPGVQQKTHGFKPKGSGMASSPRAVVSQLGLEDKKELFNRQKGCLSSRNGLSEGVEVSGLLGGQ